MKTNSAKTNEASHHSNLFIASKKGEDSFFGRTTHDQESFFGKEGSARAFIQPKLTIGKPNDKYEQEADAVADRVATMPEPTMQRQEEKEEQVQGKSIDLNIARAPEAYAFVRTTTDITEEKIQEKPAFESPGVMDSAELIDTEESQIQEKENRSIVQARGDSVSGNTSTLESNLQQSRGGGESLPVDTQSKMESGIGADFSDVQVHTGADAVQMSSELNAQAFTSGRDIYFNEGKYNPGTREGDHLLAHELTHTVQQGTNIRRKNNSISNTAINVQTGLIDSITGVVGDIKSKVVDFVRSIPGYFLFTVLIGRDPLTDENVEWNGRNIIKGFMLLLPRGLERYNKLMQEGALQRSTTWIDQQLEVIDIIRKLALSAFTQAIDSLSIKDVARPVAALERIKGYFSPAISRAVNFAARVGREVLKFLKEAVANNLVNFIKEKTRAYPLLRVVLGRDPVTREKVPRTMENIVHGFLMLSKSGEATYKKMLETGALTRATKWMRTQLAMLPTASEVIGAFTKAWQSISFEDLFQPLAAFQRIYTILNDPISRILKFVGAVAWKILVFIKDAMLGWLKSKANDIPGYHLLTVILGRDVFTRKKVPRTITNLLRGFMGLIPGGEMQFQQMKESGVIPRLASKINSAIETLGITWDFIRNLFVSIWKSLGITDLLLPLLAFVRIIVRFKEPIGRLFAFVRVVIMAVVEVLLRMMNFPFDLVGKIINNAIQAYEDIKKDPIGFLKNLMRAAKQGFKQFFDRFVQHLINGVMGWLFSELETAGIQPPADLSFKSILGLAMQVLGITVDNILARLAKKIGQEKVDRIRAMMDKLTGIWEFVKDVMERGPIAIWERIQEKLSNLWNIIVDGIKNWIVTKIIQGIAARLLSMLDPTGIMAVVNGFITFFRAVQSFIEQLTRILQVINTFVKGVGQIAKGNIMQAADFLESALVRALPVAIAFLANQVGLRGLGKRIGEMIEKAREAINAGIDWLLDKAIKAGKGLLSLGKKAIGAVKNWWKMRKSLKTRDGKAHELYFKGSGASALLIIKSDPQTVEIFTDTLKAEYNLEESKVAEVRKKAQEIDKEKRKNVPVDKEQEQGAIITGLIDKLIELLKAIPLSADIGRITDPVYGPTRNGFGVFATRGFMKKGIKDGTDAFQNTTAIYSIINKRRYGNGAYYIRGHLLNGRLGGDGHSWNNLTPLFITANNPDMYKNFEEIIQKAVLKDGGYAKNFKVVAEYNPNRNKELIKKLKQLDSDSIPSEISDDIPVNEVIEIMENEKYVPARLKCEATVKKDATSNETKLKHTVDNPISLPYSIEATAKTLFIISDKIDGKSEKDAINGLKELKGVNEAQAVANYIKLKSDNKRITYTKLFGIDRNSLHAKNTNLKIKIA